MAKVVFVEHGQSGVGNFLWIGTDDFNVYGAMGGSDGHGPAVLGMYVPSSEPNGVWQPISGKPGNVWVQIPRNILRNIPGPSFEVRNVPREFWGKPFVMPDWANQYRA